MHGCRDKEGKKDRNRKKERKKKIKDERHLAGVTDPYSFPGPLSLSYKVGENIGEAKI